MARSYKIQVLPGDGIGPEVIDEAVKVLKTVATGISGLNLSFHEFPCGGKYYLETGCEWPGEAEVFARQEADAGDLRLQRDLHGRVLRPDADAPRPPGHPRGHADPRHGRPRRRVLRARRRGPRPARSGSSRARSAAPGPTTPSCSSWPTGPGPRRTG